MVRTAVEDSEAKLRTELRAEQVASEAKLRTELRAEQQERVASDAKLRRLEDLVVFALEYSSVPTHLRHALEVAR